MSHEQGHVWTYLSNHAHVLVCLSRDPEIRLRDLAILVGITERAVARIVSDLEEAGAIMKEREGRRNRYSIVKEAKLRHNLESHIRVGHLLSFLSGGSE